MARKKELAAKLQGRKKAGPEPAKPSRVASALLSQLKSKFGVGISRITERDVVDNTVATGIDALDILLFGSLKHAGFPCGRIVELYGVENVGKTTLGCRLAANVQSRGGVAMFVDTEGTLTKKRLVQLGVNPDDLIWDESCYVEHILDHTLHVVNSLGDTLGLVFIDTIASTQTIQDRGKKVGERKVAGHATAMADGMRKLAKAVSNSNVCIVACNQQKQTINDSFFVSSRNSEATLGGSALKFHTSARVRLAFVRKIAVKRKNKFIPMGFQLSATAVKNKHSGAMEPQVQCVFNARALPDFNNALSTLRTLQQWGVVPKTSEAGKIKVLGQSQREIAYIQAYREDEPFREAMRKLLVDSYARQYLED